jgi:hypothetical protein
VGGEGDMIAEDEEMVVDERLFKSDCTRGIAGKLRIVGRRNAGLGLVASRKMDSNHEIFKDVPEGNHSSTAQPTDRSRGRFKRSLFFWNS